LLPALVGNHGLDRQVLDELRELDTQTVGGYTPGRIRTFDLCLRRAALYPLSYGRSDWSV
jgi:hypothetical protein